MRTLLIAFLLLALIPTAAAREIPPGDCSAFEFGAVVYCTDDDGNRTLVVWADPCPRVYVDDVARGGVYCWT